MEERTGDAAPRATADGFVESTLAEYGEVTRAALDRYLPKREPRKHLYDLLGDYPGRGGKMLRPSLCIAVARALGARLEDALRSAVAIELFHNAFLIHDDIEDGSEERRGRPTLHRLHGVPIAINVGDSLTLRAFQPLMENRGTLGPHLAMRILEETERMANESAEGQAIELGWRRDNVLQLDDGDYFEMILKKTCWLTTIFPCRIGALIATHDTMDLDAFVRFGFFMGAAFQIQDDLLNLVGQREGYGKEIGGDLWEGKRTLMLIHLMRQAAPSEKSRIGAALAGPREARSPADVTWLLRRFDAYGCPEYARQVARALAGAALHEYSLLFSDLPDSRDKRFVRELIPWMLERRA